MMFPAAFPAPVLGAAFDLVVFVNDSHCTVFMISAGDSLYRVLLQQDRVCISIYRHHVAPMYYLSNTCDLVGLTEGQRAVVLSEVPSKPVDCSVLMIGSHVSWKL
ncbi:hypothetical protein BKA93DRAFT_265804 [Sparassis latifolia]